MDRIISTSKGTHLLSWHRRDSCIQWCLEWAVVWIEVTFEGILPQASSTHSLSGRTGALLVDGMMLTSSVWGKDGWFQLNFVCVCVCVEKEPMIFFKRLWNLACVLSMDYFTTVIAVLLWTVIYVSQCKMQRLVSVLKRNCSVKWGINFIILGVINRAQKKAYCEETSCCRHADS